MWTKDELNQSYVDDMKRDLNGLYEFLDFIDGELIDIDDIYDDFIKLEEFWNQDNIVLNDISEMKELHVPINSFISAIEDATDDEFPAVYLWNQYGIMKIKFPFKFVNKA